MVTYTFEVRHISCVRGIADECQVVDLRHFITTLIVFDEQLSTEAKPTHYNITEHYGIIGAFIAIWKLYEIKFPVKYMEKSEMQKKEKKLATANY